MDVPPPPPARSLKRFLASIAPGLFLIGYNIGTGSVTTMAATGAAYGLTLLWPVVLSCLFTYVMIGAYGRYTAVTGRTALSSFREEFGSGWALFVLVALLISEAVSVSGVMAVVVEVVQEWTRPMTASGNGFSPILLAALFMAVLYGLFWSGRQAFFEKLLGVFVALMGVCFLLTMFMVMPDPKAFLEGLIPGIPEESHAAFLIAGMVGTTMSGVIFVVRSILVKEKGWTAGDLGLERRDAAISVSLMLLLSLAVMSAAAATLHPAGLRVDNAIQMVQLFEPLAGRFAVSLFVVGIVAAGLSSIFPNLLLAPWLLADYRGETSDLSTPQSRVIVGFVASLGLVVPIFGGRPVLVMIVSQVLGAIVTPVIVGLMWVLLNRRGVMGQYRASLSLNLTIGVIFLFSVAIAVSGLYGLSGL